MSRTIGHTKAQHFGCACYNSAKPWRTRYNRNLRHANNVIVSTAAPIDPDAIFLRREEVKDGDLYDHPGD